jgi:hypothetical protein
MQGNSLLPSTECSTTSRDASTQHKPDERHFVLGSSDHSRLPRFFARSKKLCSPVLHLQFTHTPELPFVVGNQNQPRCDRVRGDP